MSLSFHCLGSSLYWISCPLFVPFTSFAASWMGVLQEDGPLPGPETGLLPNTQKWIVGETHVLTKQEILLGKGTGVESSRVKEPRRIALPLAHSFQVVFSQSSDSESFLVVHALFSQDGCQQEGFWAVVAHVVSPFDLSWTLPVGGGSIAPCSLPGPPVVKQHMQMVTMVAGQGGQFQSVCFP